MNVTITDSSVLPKSITVTEDGKTLTISETKQPVSVAVDQLTTNITGTISSLTDTNISNIQNNQILAYNSTSGKWDNVANSGSGGIAAVVDDTTPQLGGNLDTNDKQIITVSNRDLNLYPNGTGAVEVGGNTNPGTIILNCESNSHGIKLQSPAHSAGQSYTLKFPTGNVTADRFLKVASITGSGTTGVGQLSFAEVSGGTAYQAVKTANFTAVAGQGYFVNTTVAARTATLPAGTLGDEITFIDYAGTFDTNNLTVAPNGSEKIMGTAASLTVSIERAGLTLVYTDGTQGWLLKDK